MEITKQNGDIAFAEKEHVYWNVNNPNAKYISVTTLIEKFGQPFDKDFWSAYKALEKLIPADSWKIEKKSLLSTHKITDSLLDSYNITRNDFNREQQAILDSWQAENQKSCERGTKIHSELEHAFYKAGKNVSLKKFGLGGIFECRKDYTDLDLPYGVYPEYLIHRESSDGILCLAGQIDCIVKNGNDIIIIDHKGLPLDTPILTNKGFTPMSDIVIGDKVYDMDGNLCTVTVKSDIHLNPCYKIVFTNGDSVIADKDHRWLLVTGEIRHTNDLKVGDIIPGHKAITDLDIEQSQCLEVFNVISVKTVPTQCIAVDSPTHTYLCTKSLIVTHNTNKEIKMKGGYDSKSRGTAKMKYPLNKLEDCNFMHYSLQLSTYAWMLQKINPDFVIKDLILNHYDHQGKNTLYHCEYLKDEVEAMLRFYKKQLIIDKRKEANKPIEY